MKKAIAQETLAPGTAPWRQMAADLLTEPIRYWRSLTAVGRFCAAVVIKVLTMEF
ncbi:hypothetical protein [Pseudomonas veronii]